MSLRKSEREPKRLLMAGYACYLALGVDWHKKRTVKENSLFAFFNEFLLYSSTDNSISISLVKPKQNIDNRYGEFFVFGDKHG